MFIYQDGKEYPLELEGSLHLDGSLTLLVAFRGVLRLKRHVTAEQLRGDIHVSDKGPAYRVHPKVF